MDDHSTLKDFFLPVYSSLLAESKSLRDTKGLLYFCSIKCAF